MDKEFRHQLRIARNLIEGINLDVPNTLDVIMVEGFANFLKRFKDYLKDKGKVNWTKVDISFVIELSKVE